MDEGKKNYAVIIGIGHYRQESEVYNIPFAENDARTVAKLLRDRRIGLFQEYNVTLIVNDSEKYIRSILERIFNKRDANLVLVYFSCHGTTDDNGKLRLLTSDYRSDTPRSTSISIDTIKEFMESSSIKQQVLIIDACYSGSFGRDLLTQKGDDNIGLEEIRGEGKVVILATSPIQKALKDKEKELSLFTRYFIDGITTGEASSNNLGLISIDEIFKYTKNKVIEASKDTQSPQLYGLPYSSKIYLVKNIKSDSRDALSLLNDHPKYLSVTTNWIIQTIKVPEENPESFVMSNSLSEKLKAGSYKDKNLIFVSTNIIRRSEFLNYMIRTSGKKRFFKIHDILSENPTLDEFILALQIKLGKVTNKDFKKFVFVFEENILESGSGKLLDIIVKTPLNTTIWATISEDKENQLNKWQFRRHFQMIVDTTDQFNYSNESVVHFYQMPKQAQFLAEVVNYLKIVPYEIVDNLISKTNLFSHDDFERLKGKNLINIEQGFLGSQISSVRASDDLQQILQTQLLDHEKTIVIDALLELAASVNDKLMMSTYVVLFSRIIKDMHFDQNNRMNQLLYRINGGQSCSFCNLYYENDVQYCRNCGRSLLEKKDDIIKSLERIMATVIPFPSPKCITDDKKPAFIWDEIDYSGSVT